jgi:hypothetical protein
VTVFLKDLLKRLEQPVDDGGEAFMMRPDESHRIHHHVKLPDGRDIEVVYLEHGLRDRDRFQQGSGLALHVCFHCGSELVHPLDWTEEGAESWRLLLRCPECEATREGVFTKEEIDLLEDELDRGIGSLLSDLRRMTHTNMSEEIEFFVRALRADVITPSDF